MKSWTKLWIAIGFIGITAGCKTINNAGESNLESSKPSRPTSGMPPMPAGAGIIEYVGKLSGPSAETAFNDMRREAKPNGSGGESKLAIGNIEIHCSRTAVSASAPLRGMPSATPAVKYRCEVTELRPAGQRGTPTLPFLSLEGNSAMELAQSMAGVEEKFFAEAKAYQKHIELARGQFECTKVSKPPTRVIMNGMVGPSLVYSCEVSNISGPK